MFRRDIRLLSLALCVGAGISCAPKPSQPAAAPKETSPSTSASEQPLAEPQGEPNQQSDADAEAEMMRQIAEQERLADAEADTTTESDEFEPREIVYRMAPDGMKIQMEGNEFRPKAEAFKVKGGYGVRVTIEAQSAVQTVLLNPSGGPLAFGGFVRRPDKEKISDSRKGEGEVTLEPGTPQTFTRSWPASGRSPLFYGQKLDLQVGLWGVGKNSEERRPVLKFFSVRMRVDEGGARPIIEPPNN